MGQTFLNQGTYSLAGQTELGGFLFPPGHVFDEETTVTVRLKGNGDFYIGQAQAFTGAGSEIYSGVATPVWAPYPVAAGEEFTLTYTFQSLNEAYIAPVSGTVTLSFLATLSG